jgi:hypothetical protein
VGEARLTGLTPQNGGLRLDFHATDRPDVVLREEETGAALRFPAESGADGFTSVIELTGLAHGVWHVTVDGEPLRYQPGLDPRPHRRYVDSTAVSSYFSVRDGGLALDVGGDLHAVGPDAPADGVTWREPDPGVTITGHLALPDLGMPTAVTLALRREDTVHTVIASTTPEADRLSFSATIPLLNIANGRPLPRGDWEVVVQLALSGIHRELHVQACCAPLRHPWWRRGVPMTVATTPPPGPLSLIVRHMDAGELRDTLHHRAHAD